MTRAEQIKFLEEENRTLLGVEMEMHRRREQNTKVLDKLRDEEALKKASRGSRNGDTI